MVVVAVGARPAAAVPQERPLVQLRVGEQDRAALAGGHQLAVLEAERRHVPSSPIRLPCQLRAVSVRGVLEQRDAGVRGQLRQRVHVGDQAGHVHRHDRPGAG